MLNLEKDERTKLEVEHSKRHQRTWPSLQGNSNYLGIDASGMGSFREATADPETELQPGRPAYLPEALNRILYPGRERTLSRPKGAANFPIA
jgi:hypothetical protein